MTGQRVRKLLELEDELAAQPIMHAVERQSYTMPGRYRQVTDRPRWRLGGFWF